VPRNEEGEVRNDENEVRNDENQVRNDKNQVQNDIGTEDGTSYIRVIASNNYIAERIAD
jgi:hypothetical protein